MIPSPPPIYRELAAVPGDGVLLELPTGWRNGASVLGRSDELIMMQQWYQTIHGRPRLGGNTSRNPAHKFQYFSEAPLLGDLIALMNAEKTGELWQVTIADEVDAQWETLVARNRLLAPARAGLSGRGVRHAAPRRSARRRSLSLSSRRCPSSRLMNGAGKIGAANRARSGSIAWWANKQWASRRRRGKSTLQIRRRHCIWPKAGQAWRWIACATRFVHKRIC